MESRLNRTDLILVSLVVIFLLTSIVVYAPEIEDIDAELEDKDIIPKEKPKERIAIPDIVLKNFILDKNEIYVNETLNGTFEVEILNNSNNSNLSFNTALTVYDIDYNENFEINTSGIYNFTPIVFSTDGTYLVNISLDYNNKIDEANEANNEKILEIDVLSNIIVNETNQTPAIKDETDKKIESERFYITGFGVFDFIYNKKPKIQHYIYLYGQLIQEVYGEDNKSLYYHKDFQRNAILVSDDARNIIQKNYFEPFGDGFFVKNLVYNGRRFSEKEKDRSSLYYFGARYYDSDIGRFTSVDSNLNLIESGYNYVSNNPTTFNDPDGREKKPNNKYPDNKDNKYQDKPELIVKGPHGAYYLKDQLDANELNLKHHGAIFFLDAVKLIHDQIQLTKEAVNPDMVTEDHVNLLWNEFWADVIPDGQKEQLRDGSKIGWTDHVTGVDYKKSLPPKPYTVYMRDVEDKMKKIRNVNDLAEFQYRTEFYQDESGNIYFKKFSQEPINNIQRKIFFEMVKRAIKNYKPKPIKDIELQQPGLR